MFIAALFTVAKIWKQPKCPSTDEWIKKMWVVYIYIYIHTYIYTYICVYIYINKYNGILLSHKKEWNLAICDNMDGPRWHYAKLNKSGRERQMLYDLTYMWNLRNKTNEQIKQKQSYRDLAPPEANPSLWLEWGPSCRATMCSPVPTHHAWLQLQVPEEVQATAAVPAVQEKY